jgi:hypothetical protein
MRHHAAQLPDSIVAAREPSGACRTNADPAEI